MGKIVCLLGKSGSGKDTVFGRLLAEPELVLSPLVLYTTRPMRPGERDGETYNFVTPEELSELERRYALVERRLYETVHGPWEYCTLDSGEASRPGNSICITTPLALPAYFSAFGQDNVIPVYLQVPDAARLRRSIAREEAREKPEFAEMCRRFLADEADFSEEILGGIKRLARYENIDLELCCGAIKNDLLEVL